MSSLKNLVNNLSDFQYYSGKGNFTANNLPYGKDRPGGGDSGQPYITVPPGSKWGPSNFDDLISPFGYGTAVDRGFYDVKRIGKFFLDPPKGPLWLVKQTGLQRMNPKIQLGDYKTNTPTTFFQREIGDTRLYNPLGTNTLAQVGANALGIHFTRHGLLPTTETKNAYAKQDPDSNTKFQGLRDRFAASPGSYNNDSQRLIAKYSGGPDSFLGVGNTKVLRVANKSQDDSFAAGNKNNSLNAGFVSIPLNNLFNIVSNNGVLTQLTSTGTETIPKTFDFSVQDFREYKNKELGTTLEYSDYKNKNMESRIGVMRTKYGTQKSPQKPTFATASLEGGSDRVNMVSLYNSAIPGDTVGVKDFNGNDVKSSIIRDLIKFRIKAFNNDSTGLMGTYMVFRAFITSFSDTMNSTWNPYSYVGRGENFYLYDGFTQNISIGFKAVAFSREEMKPMYQKLNYLKSCMTPDYTSGGKMRGNIMELTVGDYIHYLPGVITDLNYTIPQDANWEIALDYFQGERDEDMHELPQMIDVTMTFIPIYTFLPRKGYGRPFIGIEDYRRGKTPQVVSGYEAEQKMVGSSEKRDWVRASNTTDFPIK